MPLSAAVAHVHVYEGEKYEDGKRLGAVVKGDKNRKVVDKNVLDKKAALTVLLGKARLPMVSGGGCIFDNHADEEHDLHYDRCTPT